MVLATDDEGNVDVADLRAKLDEGGDRVAAIMLTYPSTHGVFEQAIGEICAAVHDAGGQVYVDGANLNALVGIARPGPVRRRRQPPQPAQDVLHPPRRRRTRRRPDRRAGAPRRRSSRAIRSAEPTRPSVRSPRRRIGSAGHPADPVGLPGADGRRRAAPGDGGGHLLGQLRRATRLARHFPVLYTGRHGRVGHECIVDLRPITRHTGVTVDDVAKRLMDYGFHAPTMSFPVAGTLMIEPTESETLAELDRFCDAMIAIRGEIDRVADGVWPLESSPLRNAPHTAEALLGDWDRPYPRALGAYPLACCGSGKYFPPVLADRRRRRATATWSARASRWRPTRPSLSSA